MVGEGCRRAEEGDHADQDQCRRQPRDIERQDLHDERCAHIGAQHQGQPGADCDQAPAGEGDQQKYGGGRTLQ